MRPVIAFFNNKGGVGKTSLGLNIAQHASKKTGESVGIFSLEMSNEQLVQRIVAQETGINLSSEKNIPLEITK